MIARMVSSSAALCSGSVAAADIRRSAATCAAASASSSSTLRSGSTPVPSQLVRVNRVDGADAGDPYAEVLGDALYAARMCAAAGRLTHDGGAPQALQVLAELLRRREGAVARRDVDRPVGSVARTRDFVQSPTLLRMIARARVLGN